MQNDWITLAIFVIGYALFATMPKWRPWVACACAAAMVVTGRLELADAIGHKVNWNVIALFWGTLVLAELFMLSRMPAVLAERLVDKMPTVRGAMVAVCLLASFLSMFVENVAVVLIVAPIALSLSEKIEIKPVRLLILLAICSNLQGTATLIGDPPSMIMAGYMKMNFNDFFVYLGKPGIFFAVQVGMLASMAVVAWMLRRHRNAITLIAVEKVKSSVPSILMLLLIVGLALTSAIDPDFKWFAGAFTCALALCGIVWLWRGPRWVTVKELVKALDWGTTIFLIGVFVMTGGLSESGWLDRLAAWMARVVGTNLAAAFIAIVAVAVLVSAVVDNVPFLLAMIPVAQKVSDQTGTAAPLLLFGLLIGSCLGGNITPIGASANIVSVGILKKRGYQVSFGEFMAVGMPFTLAAVVAACLMVWLIWAPK